MVRFLRRLAWASRKLRLPVSSRDLVLEVGSGANPHPRADVLVDKYVSNWHRLGGSLVVDRPLVLADGCSLPFRDRTFDFVMSSHVLEHMRAPERFLSEYQRVAKAGYIEAPHAIWEELRGMPCHSLFLEVVEDELLLTKKTSPVAKPKLAERFRTVLKTERDWNAFHIDNVERLTIRYFWKDNIRFRVTNPEYEWDWDVEGIPEEPAVKRWRFVKWAYRCWRRLVGRHVRLEALLVCPRCRGELSYDEDGARCVACGTAYPRRNGALDLVVERRGEEP